MNKTIEKYPTYRKMEIGPDWHKRAVAVVQNARADGLVGECEISIDAIYFLSADGTHEIMLAIKSAQQQAAQWNKDAGKPAGDVLK